MPRRRSNLSIRMRHKHGTSKTRWIDPRCQKSWPSVVSGDRKTRLVLSAALLILPRWEKLGCQIAFHLSLLVRTNRNTAPERWPEPSSPFRQGFGHNSLPIHGKISRTLHGRYSIRCAGTLRPATNFWVLGCIGTFDSPSHGFVSIPKIAQQDRWMLGCLLTHCKNLMPSKNIQMSIVSA